MDHPPRQEILPPKNPRPRLFHLFMLLAGLFHISLGLGQVSKSVREMAALSCGYNVSLDELDRVRVYWQKDSAMVLSIISGVVTVWPEYKNRTFSDIANNLSLVILGLRLSDEGTYTCVVQKNDKGNYRVKHLMPVTLTIRADFPIPAITELEDPFPDTKRIMCAASGGFPQPHLSWLENGTELNDINTTISQDPETKLYTVISTMDFNATYNHSIVCRVEYGDSEVLKNFTWEKHPGDPPDSQPPNLVFILSPLIIVISAIPICCLICILFKRWRIRRNEARGNEEVFRMYTGPPEAWTEHNV